MSSYQRTKITRLRVAGLRSLRDVELVDLPDLVVLHGPNGSGKSTIGRAVALALRWTGLVGDQPTVTLHHDEARELADVESDDFARGGNGTIELELEIDLGPAASSILKLHTLARGHASIAVRATDLGAERGIAIAVERARLRRSDLADSIRRAESQLQLARDELHATPKGLQRTDELGTKVTQLERSLRDLQGSQETDLSNRPQAVHLASVLELIDAFRRVGREAIPQRRGVDVAPEQLQTLLRAAALSPHPVEHQFFESLPSVLADAGLFAGQVSRVRAAEDERFGEVRVLVSTPHHKDIPLTQLGTGEQQIIALITRTCLRGRPIVMVQEPEAHLHSSTQLQLARFLERSIEDGSGPEGRARFDQLWIETHQHSFAIAPEYFDVSLDAEGFTKIEKRPRSLAQTHFYEPGPVFDALRQLVDETHEIGPDQVVFHDADGNPVSAAQLRASLDGDQALAQQYVAQVTRTVVNMLEKATRRPKP